MKIRTHLFISYVAVIVVTLILTAGLTNTTMEEQTEDNLDTARTGVEDITQANYMLSKKILTSFGEDLVRLQAQSLAKELSLILRDRPSLDYDQLRRDEGLRKIATQDILTRWGPAGYMDVLDNTGLAVLHPNKNVEGRNFAEWADKFPEMWALVKRSFTEKEVRGYYTFIDRHNKTRRKYMVLIQVPDTPLIVVGAVNIKQFFLPVWNKISLAAEISKDQANQNIWLAGDEALFKMRRATALGLLAALIVGLGFAVWFSASISRPIHALQDGLANMGRGEFKIQVEPTGMAEIQQLGQSFNLLGEQLIDYTERLKEETAAREAVMGDFRAARQIQETLLPHDFPAFPERTDFSLHAANVAAKEVAGDFYDFFFIDKDRLALLIADVSDKGLPAALFMAVTRTLFRDICPNEPNPAKAVERANLVLCEDNEACMFVTLILAYYDTRTGLLDYVNAGHNEAFVLKAGPHCSGFGLQGGRALGIVTDQQYKPGQANLAEGDLLVLYTDGLTEASSPEGEFFGKERFQDLLCAHADAPVETITERVMDAVEDFQKGEHFDDMTMLILRRGKSGKTGADSPSHR